MSESRFLVETLTPDSHEFISDEELCALALSEDYSGDVAPDAVALRLSSASSGSLPSWYMPAVSAVQVSRWRSIVIVGLVATLVTLEALGLCSIFGQVVIG